MAKETKKELSLIVRFKNMALAGFDKFKKGIEDTNKSFDKFIKKGGAAGKAVGAIRDKIKSFIGPAELAKKAMQLVAVVFASVAAAIAVSIKKFIELDQAMRKATVRFSLGEKGLKKFTTEARRVAKEYGKTTGEVVSGLEAIINTGARSTAAIDVLDQAAKGSVATFEPVADVASAVATTLDNLGAGFNRYSDTQDKLLVGVREGESDFAHFTSAINLSASQFRTAGFSLEDTIAIFAQLSTVTGTANKASRKLGSGLKIMIDETKGAVTGVNFIEKLRDVRNELTEFGKIKYSDVAVGKIEQSILKVFKATETAPFKILLENLDALEDKVKQVNGAAGETDRQFKRASESIGFQLAKAKSRVNDVFLALGERLSPAIKTFATFAPAAVDGVTRSFERLFNRITEGVTGVQGTQLNLDIFTAQVEAQTSKAIATAEKLVELSKGGLKGLINPLNLFAEGKQLANLFKAPGQLKEAFGEIDVRKEAQIELAKAADDIRKEYEPVLKKLSDDYEAGIVDALSKKEQELIIESAKLKAVLDLKIEVPEDTKSDIKARIRSIQDQITEVGIERVRQAEEAVTRAAQQAEQDAIAAQTAAAEAEEERLKNLAIAIQGVKDKYSQTRLEVEKTFAKGEISEYEKTLKMLNVDLEETRELLKTGTATTAERLDLEIKEAQTIKALSDAEKARIVENGEKSLELAAKQKRLAVEQNESLSDQQRSVALQKLEVESISKMIEFIKENRSDEADSLAKILDLEIQREGVERNITKEVKAQLDAIIAQSVEAAKTLGEGLDKAKEENLDKARGRKAGKEAARSRLTGAILAAEPQTRDELMQRQALEEKLLKADFEAAKLESESVEERGLLKQARDIELEQLAEKQRLELVNFDIAQKELDIQRVQLALLRDEITEQEALIQTARLRGEIADIGRAGGVSESDQMSADQAAAGALKDTQIEFLNIRDTLREAIRGGFEEGAGTFEDIIKDRMKAALIEAATDKAVGLLFGENIGLGVQQGGAGAGNIVGSLMGGGGGGLLGSLFGDGGKTGIKGGLFSSGGGIGGLLGKAVPWLGVASLVGGLLGGNNPPAATSSAALADPRFQSGVGSTDVSGALLGSEIFRGASFSSRNANNSLARSFTEPRIKIDLDVATEAGFDARIKSVIVKGVSDDGNFGQSINEV